MKKRDTNQMDLFAMTNTESSDISPAQPSSSTPIIPDPPQASPEPIAANTAPDAPEPDSSFSPADWETPDVDSSVPSETVETDCMTEPTPDEDAKDDFALFESDPFFNPSVASHQQPAVQSPLPQTLSAEERLLEEIVQYKPANDANTSLSDVNAEQLIRELQVAVAALEGSRQEANKLRAQCSTLEEERNAARRDAEKERQLRSETLRNRQPSTFKPTPQEIFSRRPQTKEIGISKRTLYLALPGILVLCLLAYSLGRRQAPGTVTFIGTDEMPVAIDSPALPEAQPPRPEATQPVSVPWPSFEGSGYQVTGDNSSRRIVFNYGAFSRGTIIAETAQRDLAKIAAAFKQDIAAFKIEVEGHTDSTPVRSTHAFADNHELALARATAVAEFLTGKCGLPQEAVAAIAGDNNNPPHKGTTPDIQKKNRTVALKLIRR